MLKTIFGRLCISGEANRPALAVVLRLRIAFLHSVFGIGPVAQQIAGQCVDVVEVGQRGLANAPRLVMGVAAAVDRHHIPPGSQDAAWACDSVRPRISAPRCLRQASGAVSNVRRFKSCFAMIIPSPRRVEMNGQGMIAIPSPVLSRPQLWRRSVTWKIKSDLGTISQRYFVAIA